MTDLETLLAAKSRSDERKYAAKHILIRQMMNARPGDFAIDSDDGRGIVGVTHRPTGFRFHMPKQKVKPGIEKAAGGLGGALSKLRGAFKQVPLFGEEIAQKARANGVTIRTVADSKVDADGALPFERFLRPASVRALWQTARLPKNPGVFVDFGGAGPNALKGKDFLGRRTPAQERLAGAMGKSKYREATELPGLIAETHRVGDLAESLGVNPRNSNALHEALVKRFGNYVMKFDDSAASSADSLHTDLKGASSLREFMRGSPSNKIVVQPRLDLAPLDRVGRSINQTGQIAFDGRLRELGGVLSRDPAQRATARGLWRAVAGGKADFPLGFSLTGGKGKEYRVHVLNGKVVPYATSERGTLRGALPWRTGNHRRAEEALASKLDALPPEQRAKLQGGFGFDVMKGRKEGWHVIETNPSEVGGGSGFVSDHPAIQDALAAAIEGRLPRYIKAQRAIEGTAAGGLGLVGYSALGGKDERSVS